MRFQVPQFVDIEDKIIGPLTLKQFMTYMVALMICVPLFITFDLSLFLTLAIPIIAVAGLFAHLRPNGKSLFVLVGSATNFFMKGQLFLWRRTASDRLLVVKGEEYGEYATEEKQPASLSQRARDLETKGSVVKDDAEDPLVEGNTT